MECNLYNHENTAQAEKELEQIFDTFEQQCVAWRRRWQSLGARDTAALEQFEVNIENMADRIKHAR